MYYSKTKVAIISLVVTIIVFVSSSIISVNSVGCKIDEDKREYNAIMNAECNSVIDIKSTYIDDKNIFIVKKIVDNGESISVIGKTYYGEMLKFDLEKDFDFELQRKELIMRSMIGALLLSLSFGLIVYFGIVYMRPNVDEMF